MDYRDLPSYQMIYHIRRKSHIRYWIIGFFVFFLITLFLPWTQNIKTTGSVTAIRQEDRPQELHSPIPGKIVHWYVKNGDMVKKGDTLLRLSEIKDDYLDPQLISRTEAQVEAKKTMQDMYASKVETGASQIDALENARELKLKQLDLKARQTETKLSADRAGLEAARTEYRLAADQYSRQEKM